MSINNFRGLLYGLAKLLGDVQAITSPKPNAIPKRVARRIVGKGTGRFLGWLFK